MIRKTVKIVLIVAAELTSPSRPSATIKLTTVSDQNGRPTNPVSGSLTLVMIRLILVCCSPGSGQ